jgi:hypothetical protein
MASREAVASWADKVGRLSAAFAKKHAILLRSTERQLSASFEVGCFHAIVQFYELQKYRVAPAGLVHGGYRYLTTPSGNPNNFSYVELFGGDGEFELRQQVRVESHVDPEICFTPDIVVIRKGSRIDGAKRDDFASGKRSFFRVSSVDVVAAHECKSTNPFPELLVSFIGMLVAAHEWYPNGGRVEVTKGRGHLAPTLFVGGTAKRLHLRMIAAMQKSYGLNVVCGLHEGTWGLKGVGNRLICRSMGKGATLGVDIPF